MLIVVYIAETYLESSQTSNLDLFVEIINGYKGEFKTLSNIYDGAFSQKLLTALIIFITSVFQVFYFMKKYYFFNKRVIPEVFIRCKVCGLRKPEGGGREFWIHLIADVFR